MFSLVKDALKKLSGEAEPESSMSEEHALKLATALLLIEVARADFEWEEGEAVAIVARLTRSFDLSAEEAEILLNEAKSEAEERVSLYETLKVINQSCDPAAKRTILLDCWRVAYVDGVLDKQEEGLIRQIADWLYLPHKDFIRLKHQAEVAATSDGG